MSNLAKIEEGKLNEVVSNQGLAIEEGEQIKQSFQPLIEQLAVIYEEAGKINFENPTALDEKIARELRLRTVKIRTEASRVKDDRKKIHLLKANVEQRAYQLIEADCKLKEEVFNQIEKAREIAEKKAKEERKITREATLTELGFDYAYTDLLNMPDIQFDELVLKIENEISAKQEADRLAKLEEERLENVKKLKEERTTIAMPYYQFWSEFEKTLNFGEVSEIDFNAFIDKCKNAKAKFDEDQEKIRLENERLQEEVRQNEEKQQVRKNRNKKRDAELAPYIVFIRDYSSMLEMDDADYDKELADIKVAKKQQDDFNASEQLRINGEIAKRKDNAVEFLISVGYGHDEFGMTAKKYHHFIGAKHYSELESDNELELFKQGVIATKEREDANEKTRLETAKNEELTKKLLLKQQEDNKIAKANELAKKKAAAAPDKDKLTALVKLIEDIEMPIMDTDEANSILESVDQLLGKVCTFIEQKRDQL